MTKVCIADDHGIVREALRDYLAAREDIEITGEAADGPTALELVRTTQPDVLVLDISMPGMDGIEVIRRLRKAGACVKVVVLTTYEDRQVVEAALAAGAQAYVAKSGGGAELLRGIRAAAEGKVYLCPVAARAAARRFNAGGADAPPPASILGSREREVLGMIARGLRSSAIAERMNVSPATVETHRRNIMAKLNMHSVADLTRYAVREGLAAL